jgi:hypothetical protein
VLDSSIDPYCEYSSFEPDSNGSNSLFSRVLDAQVDELVSDLQARANTVEQKWYGLD